LARETFYRELPAIDQHARELKREYKLRFQKAAQSRQKVYTKAIQSLETTPGWEKLTEEQRKIIKEPLTVYSAGGEDMSEGIPQVRSDYDAMTSRLNKAVEDMMRLVDGNRVVRVSVSGFFAGGVETEEQLDAALKGLREECERHIGAGKKVLIQ
jgi:hypothetical protein